MLLLKNLLPLRFLGFHHLAQAYKGWCPVSIGAIGHISPQNLGSGAGWNEDGCLGVRSEFGFERLEEKATANQPINHSEFLIGHGGDSALIGLVPGNIYYGEFSGLLSPSKAC